MSEKFSILFTVDGDPVAWARHKGSGKRSWTDPKVKAFKDLVTVQARLAMAGQAPITGPCQVDLAFFLPPPPAVLKVLRESHRLAKLPYVPAITKPDLSNFAKGVEDAMNQVVYVDDAQIINERLSKIYSEKPKTVVMVRTISMPEESGWDYRLESSGST